MIGTLHRTSSSFPAPLLLLACQRCDAGCAPSARGRRAVRVRLCGCSAGCAMRSDGRRAVCFACSLGRLDLLGRHVWDVHLSQLALPQLSRQCRARSQQSAHLLSASAAGMPRTRGLITHKDSAPAAIKAQSSVHVARNAIRVVASSVANNTSSAWLNSKRRAAGTETASNPLDIKCPVIIRRAVRLLPSK